MNRAGSSYRMSVLVTAVVAAGPAACASAPSTQPNLDATLWVQTAAEYGALTRSVYLGATRDLSDLLSDSAASAALEQDGDFSELPPAVILDVDETVLDNSPYQARLLLAEELYSSDTWAVWVDQRMAEPVPGALEFTRAADHLGITVFYVTNRRASQEAATRENLNAVGFPLRDEVDVVLTRYERPEWDGTKSARRRFVANNYRVLMLVGDDLNDFIDVEGLSVVERNEAAERFGGYWGERWQVLPNPTYGSWERALFDFDFGLTASERTDRKTTHLEPRGENHE